jgi:2',3'-cyclic-nucleotide 2'-phosphodiesterase
MPERRVLFIGDVVGEPGRKALETTLPILLEQHAPDLVVTNGENVAGGLGITERTARKLHDAGTDVITTGNHVFDQREIIPKLDREPRLIRPLNMMPGTPGRGSVELRLVDGRKLVVLQIMGRLFMGAYDDPFRALETELAKYALGATAHALVVDVHAEATSEKMALGHLADGRASAVIGTHTHVPTADAWILPGGTAYITDVGMTGDYDSVIGMHKPASLQRFRTHVPAGRIVPALGEGTLCAVFLETDDRTGLARRIEPLRMGGRLPETPTVIG